MEIAFQFLFWKTFIGQKEVDPCSVLFGLFNPLDLVVETDISIECFFVSLFFTFFLFLWYSITTGLVFFLYVVCQSRCNCYNNSCICFIKFYSSIIVRRQSLLLLLFLSEISNDCIHGNNFIISPVSSVYDLFVYISIIFLHAIAFSFASLMLLFAPEIMLDFITALMFA